MPRIRCHYEDCVFLDEGFCAAAAVELDPEEGCLTYSPSGGASEDAWEENEATEEDWEEAGFAPEGEEDEWEPEDAEEEDAEEEEDEG
jgi:hypothetical protein